MTLELMDRRQFAALVLSALLHLLVTLALTMEDLSALLPQHHEKTMEVEVVNEPTPPTKPDPQVQPPPPEPSQPKPVDKDGPPVTTPQLQKAQLAAKSAAPAHPVARPEPAKPS